MKNRIAIAGISFVVLQACTIMSGEERALLDPNRNHVEATSPAPVERLESAADASVLDANLPPQHTGDASTPTTGGVECGGKKCEGTTPLCCAASNGGTCVAATTTSCTQKRFFMRCDDPTDCSGSDVCCARWTETVFESACMTAAACLAHGGPNNVLNGSGHMCLNEGQCPADHGCTGSLWDDAELAIDMTAGICMPKAK